MLGGVVSVMVYYELRSLDPDGFAAQHYKRFDAIKRGGIESLPHEDLRVEESGQGRHGSRDNGQIRQARRVVEDSAEDPGILFCNNIRNRDRDLCQLGVARRNR